MFVANLPPLGDLENLRSYLTQEFQRLAIALEVNQVESIQLVERHSAPNKPRDGLVVFADGTNWNPGGGRGVYVYSSAAWVKL